MLIPFAIDADSLTPDPGWTPAQLHQYHLSLLDIWRRIGLLVHDADTFDHSRLNSAIQRLPQKIRPLWLDMLEHSPPRKCGANWDGSITNNTVPMLKHDTEVVLVDDTCAEIEFGLPDDELSQVVAGVPEIELCRLTAAAQSKTFENALNIAESYIQPRTPFRKIWKERFLTLAKAPIKLVSVVDRYAVSQHFNCPQSRLSGLERFLRLLDDDADGARNVTLFSGWSAELRQQTMPDIEAELQMVLRRLRQKRIKQLKIIMVPNAVFGSLSHDRFIRFENYVWDIGLGLKVFEGAFAAERSSASFKTGSVSKAGYKKVEDELTEHNEAKQATVLP